MKVIAIVNQKGGVAKTTTTITVARGLALKGKKVALIDFDPQGNSTRGLGIDKNECKYTIYELLKKQVLRREYEELEYENVIIKKFDIDIIPANITMSKFDRELGSFPGKDNYLKKLISKNMTQYDYILIDCPPSLGIHTDNALTAADEVLIPVSADIYAVEGIVDLLDEIELIKEDTNEKLKIGGVLVTIADNRTTLHNETMAELKKYFPNEIYNTYIRRSEEVKKAAKEGMVILDYNPESNAAIDYSNLVLEIIERG